MSINRKVKVLILFTLIFNLFILDIFIPNYSVGKVISYIGITLNILSIVFFDIIN